MDLATKAVKAYFSFRVRAIERYSTDFEAVQRSCLENLLKTASATEWGRRYGFSTLKDYSEYARTVPLVRYEAIRDDMIRIMNGERDILWPGQIPYIALSSGTTSDRCKFIPVSRRSLRKCHLQGGRDVTATYLAQTGDSYVSKGWQLALSGKFRPEWNNRYILAGDVSAIMQAQIPPVFRRMLHFAPPVEMANMEDYHQKFDAIAHYVLDKNVTSVSGAPSWLLTVLNRVLELSGKENLSEVWPGMELVTHGGMGFGPYRPLFQRLFPHGVHYKETFNASEGFFGVQTDEKDPSMMLMLDYDIFFEFIPMSVYGTPEEYAIPLWEVEPGVDYSLVLTTASGLWRYDICDIIRFTRKAPYKFVITGRTRQTLESCGESMSVAQAERALTAACLETGSVVSEFTVAPLFLPDGRVRHQWLIEFRREGVPAEAFGKVLDRILQEQSEHYHSKRSDDHPLMHLEVLEARKGLFHAWLDAQGKFGGQHKVPRLSVERKYLESLLEMNAVT